MVTYEFILEVFFYIFFIFAVMRIMVSVLNFFSRPYLRKNINVDNSKYKPVMFSILIPARNEEKRISNLLDSIIQQSYTNFEVIVYNDNSFDNTSDIVRNYSLVDERIRVIDGEELPCGWVGKNYACHVLASMARGDYMIFVDSDVYFSSDFLLSLWFYLQKNDFCFLSIFPEQVLITIGEKITVPIMNRVLLSLLPLLFVSVTNFAYLSAANGQCMIFKREVYINNLPHFVFKDSLVEDIMIARYLKKNRHKIQCLLGNGFIYCRMYENYLEAVNGFSKNIRQMFIDSYFLCFFYGFSSNFSSLVLYFLYNPKFGFILLFLNFLVYCINMITSNFKVSIIYWIMQDLVFWHIFALSIYSRLKGRYEWKNRKIKVN